MPRLLAALLVAALLLVAPGSPAGAEVDPAVTALRKDSSLKVRTQAAILLGQRGSPDAIAALREAVADDRASAVRLAAISALGRLQARGARGTLEAAVQADPDAAVRNAAARTLTALGPVTLTVEEAGGPSGARLSAAVAGQLRQRGLVVAEQGELRVKPKVAVEVAEGGGRTTFEARASLAVLDGDGRIDLLETSAKAAVSGTVAEGRRGAYVQKVVEAAGRGLGDDLAVKLGRR
jgi:hypothetical protein